MGPIFRFYSLYPIFAAIASRKRAFFLHPGKNAVLHTCRNCRTSADVLKAEKLTRTVPVSSVPPLRWAIGAQCSPARTAIPASARRRAASSQSRSRQRNDRTPLAPAP